MIDGARILERLSTLGISQSELARRVGVSQPAINTLIRGKGRHSAHLHRIARELRTTPAYLEGETDDPTLEAPEEPFLSSVERELVEIMRSLAPAQQQTLLAFLKSMFQPTLGMRLQSPAPGFKGRGD